MHTGKRFEPLEFALWTKNSILVLLILSAIPTVLYHFGYTFVALPWAPMAVLGTAVSFIIGFKNNASYGRLWEARQIYGAIINNSRSFAYILRDALYDKDPKNVDIFFKRHYAWLTAMRFQLRQPRLWENLSEGHAKTYAEKYDIPELTSKLEDELKPFLSDQEWKFILSKKTKRPSFWLCKVNHWQKYIKTVKSMIFNGHRLIKNW